MSYTREPLSVPEAQCLILELIRIENGLLHHEDALTLWDAMTPEEQLEVVKRAIP